MPKDEWKRRVFNGLLLFLLLEVAGLCLLALLRSVLTDSPHINPQRAANYHQVLNIINWFWLVISVVIGLLWGRFCTLEPRKTQRYQHQHPRKPVYPRPTQPKSLVDVTIKPQQPDPNADLPKCAICGRTQEEADYLIECDVCRRVVCSNCVYKDAPDHHWTTCHRCGRSGS